MKKLSIICGLILSANAIGCASGPDFQLQVERLTSENQRLRDRTVQTSGELAACQTRCDSLQNELANRPELPPKPSKNYLLPEDLKETGLNVERRGNHTVIAIPSDLFFRSGSSSLNGSGERALMQVASVLKKKYPQGKIRIEGHTDSDPIRKTKKQFHCNFDLGFERAHRVAHTMTEKGGIQASRIVCESYGPYDPIDPSSKTKNRRVQIVIAQ